MKIFMGFCRDRKVTILMIPDTSPSPAVYGICSSERECARCIR
jgi:hypothetical protein